MYKEGSSHDLLQSAILIFTWRDGRNLQRTYGSLVPQLSF